MVVKIYRQKAPTTASGYAYAVTWVGPDGRVKKTYSDLKKAQEDATLKAAQLANGLAGGHLLSRSDSIELTEARLTVEPHGVPLLSAVNEWAKARELVGPGILGICSEWASRRTATVKRIKVTAAVEQFIAAKDAAKKRGSRTYTSKLKRVKTELGEYFLDTVSVQDWTRVLHLAEDAVTRNDLRKRIVTLCRWAKRQGHLSDDITPEIEKTERAKETAHPIGILRPKEYGDFLEYIRANHPQHLAAVVIAGFCGVRADEIQGKVDARERRQLWEDINLGENFMSVTIAKTNTPAHRIIHLSETALAWLNVCPGPREGPICEAGAMEKVRLIARKAEINLPENCFRHSWITYRIALTGDKAATATEAGNSVGEIDLRYRVPKPKSEGEAWFALRPKLTE